MIASHKSMSNMEWEGAGVPEAPTAPESLKQAGLTLNFLNDLLMRTLYVQGIMLGLDLARSVCLPFKVIEESLVFLKDEKCVEVQGGDLIGRISHRFNLTDLGRKRAQEALKMCAYVGPAPVPLEDYVEQVYRQALALDRERFGDPHRSIAIDLNNLGNVLQDQGRFAEAIPAYRQALRFRQRGSEHAGNDHFVGASKGAGEVVLEDAPA